MQLMSLVDLGSSDSSINSGFVERHHLAGYTIPAIRLHLIDGTCNSIITQAIKLHMLFVWQEANHEFLCYPLGLELHPCGQTLLAHLLQSIN